jgi:hypothetical protein
MAKRFDYVLIGCANFIVQLVVVPGVARDFLYDKHINQNPTWPNLAWPDLTKPNLTWPNLTTPFLT